MTTPAMKVAIELVGASTEVTVAIKPQTVSESKDEDDAQPETFSIIEEFPIYAISSHGYIIRLTDGFRPKISVNKSTGYLRVTLRTESGSYKRRDIHRLLALAFIPNENPDNYNVVDHKDGNKLNNSLSNLRWCDRRLNNANSKISRTNTSGFKGVTFHKRVGKWQAQASVNGKTKYLGYFECPEKAHAAYCAAAKTQYGEFARFE